MKCPRRSARTAGGTPPRSGAGRGCRAAAACGSPSAPTSGHLARRASAQSCAAAGSSRVQPAAVRRRRRRSSAPRQPGERGRRQDAVRLAADPHGRDRAAAAHVAGEERRACRSTAPAPKTGCSIVCQVVAPASPATARCSWRGPRAGRCRRRPAPPVSTAGSTPSSSASHCPSVLSVQSSPGTGGCGRGRASKRSRRPRRRRPEPDGASSVLLVGVPCGSRREPGAAVLWWVMQRLQLGPGLPASSDRAGPSTTSRSSPPRICVGQRHPEPHADRHGAVEVDQPAQVVRHVQLAVAVEAKLVGVRGGRVGADDQAAGTVLPVTSSTGWPPA